VLSSKSKSDVRSAKSEIQRDKQKVRLFDSKGNTLTSTRRFFLLFSAMLGVGAIGQRIIPAIADDLELVRVELVDFHDAPAHGVRAVVGELAHEIGGDNAFAAGVGVALDDDIGIAEPAGEFANLIEGGRNGVVVIGVEHDLFGSKETITALVRIWPAPASGLIFISASGLKVGWERSRTSL